MLHRPAMSSAPALSRLDRAIFASISAMSVFVLFAPLF